MRVWFRYEKYREEFSAEDVIIAIDETPVGTFVEIEGGEEHIHAAAAALGKTPADYITDSYRTLFSSTAAHAQASTCLRDMLFAESSMTDLSRLARAGPHGGPGDPTSTAVGRPRKGGDAGGRPADRRPHSRLAARGRRAPRRPQPAPSARNHHARWSATAQLGPRRALLVGARVLGSAGGPRRALPLLDAERFLIVNGDTLTDCDLRAVVDRHVDARRLVTMAVVPGDVAALRRRARSIEHSRSRIRRASLPARARCTHRRAPSTGVHG